MVPKVPALSAGSLRVNSFLSRASFALTSDRSVPTRDGSCFVTWGSGGRKVGGVLPSLGSATVINVHEAVLNCVTLVTSLKTAVLQFLPLLMWECW